jgi:hypothetical protein
MAAKSHTHISLFSKAQSIFNLVSSARALNIWAKVPISYGSRDEASASSTTCRWMRRQSQRSLLCFGKIHLHHYMSTCSYIKMINKYCQVSKRHQQRPKGAATKQRAPDQPVLTHLSSARACMKIWCFLCRDSANRCRELYAL